jgi:hypothetical protein
VIPVPTLALKLTVSVFASPNVVTPDTDKLITVSKLPDGLYVISTSVYKDS